MRILRGHTDTVRAVAYAPDGRTLASGGEDRTVRFWDLAAGEASEVVVPAGGRVETLDFSPGGEVLAAGTAEGQLLHMGRAGRPLRSVTAHRGGVRCVRFSRDGGVIATCGWSEPVRLWKADDLSSLPALEGSENASSLAFTPDGSSLLAACTSGAMLSYRWTSGGSHAPLTTGASLISVACSPDGRLFATGDAAGGITVWDLTTRREHVRLPGHTWAVYGLAFLPGGRGLVSGSADGTVRVWDVGTGREAACFQWHARWVTCVAVSPDGSTAAAGSEDRTVVVFDLPEL